MNDSRPSSITSKPATIIEAMRFGDTVSVWGTILRVDLDDPGLPLLVCLGVSKEEVSCWCSLSDIATHTPRPRTLEEFESMPIEVRQGVWDDMNKRCGGDKT